MSTSYNPNFPNPPDSPANDVQIMQNNAMAIYYIWAKDHYTFENANNFDGLHAQVTFPASNIPSSPTNPSSIVFTASPQDSGLATNTITGGAATISEAFYINSQTTLLLSCVKAFGRFVDTGSFEPVTGINGLNIVSIVYNSGPNTYSITLNTNCTNGSNVTVFSTNATSGSNPFVSPVLTLKPSNYRNSIISFLVLQA